MLCDCSHIPLQHPKEKIKLRKRKEKKILESKYIMTHTIDIYLDIILLVLSIMFYIYDIMSYNGSYNYNHISLHCLRNKSKIKKSIKSKKIDKRKENQNQIQEFKHTITDNIKVQDNRLGLF